MPKLPKRCKYGKSGPTSAEVTRHRFRDSAKAAAIRIRNSQRWKDCRLVKLSLHPLCENPLGLHDGALIPTQQVHHLIELAKAPHLAFTMSNLQSVCIDCHAVLSEEERRT